MIKVAPSYRFPAEIDVPGGEAASDSRTTSASVLIIQVGVIS